MARDMGCQSFGGKVAREFLGQRLPLVYLCADNADVQISNQITATA